MLKDKENSRKQGDVGLGAAIGWFTEQGYTTCVPLTDSQKYDLVVEIDEDLKKIQVKTCSYKRGSSYELMLKTCGGNKSGSKMYLFDNKLIDYLFILVEDGTRYFIPAQDIKATHGMVLGNKYSKYIL